MVGRHPYNDQQVESYGGVFVGTSGVAPSRFLEVAAGLALAANYLPSTVTLGQWSSLRSLPGDLCRWRGPKGQRVALTFDDGPNRHTTPQMLDRLDELGLRATFFCVGSLVERDGDIVDEIARRGHQVETHGYRHEHHLLRSPRWIVNDLRRAVEVMAQCGHPSSWYRPSYGQATGATLVAARALGLRTVLWSSWGREWTTDDPDDVAERIISSLGGGAIILLHDNDELGSPGMWRVGQSSLPRVAAELERRELVAVTLDELIDGARSGPHRLGAGHDTVAPSMGSTTPDR
jgi:peptidoglycan/xylan/chitin deacetylase (PgdA/CDA1 family)